MKDRPSGRDCVMILIVACVALICYMNNIGNDWAYDDHEYITRNTFVTESGHFGDIVSTTYLYGVGGARTALYRPLTVLSYALNRQMTGLEPRWFHLVNNLIHAANSGLTFAVVSLLPCGGVVAFPAALLFATHPIHTEAVTNTVGRAELLAYFFTMLALTAFLLRDRKRAVWIPLALVFFFLALLCKETPASFPLVAMLLIIGDRIRDGQRALRDDGIVLLGFVIVLGLYMAIRASVIARCGPVAPIMMHDNPLATMTFFGRLPTALAVTVRYLALLVAPVTLSADYSYNQIPLYGSLFALAPLSGLVIVAAGIAGCAYAVRRSLVWFSGFVLFTGPYLVVSNIAFPTGTIMGERLMYFPSLGFVLLLACLLHVIAGCLNMTPRKLMWTAAVIALVYTGRTVVRNADWRDNETIFVKTAETSPNSVKTAYNYALVLKRQGRPGEAIEWYRRAIGIWPGHQSAWFNLGNALRQIGRHEEALTAYRRASELAPGDTGSLNNMALTLRHLGRHGEAVTMFERLLEIRPGDTGTRMNIGTTLAGAEQYDEALEVFGRLAEGSPAAADALVNMGNIHIIQGDSLYAEKLYRRSLEIASDNPAAHNALLGLALSRGDYGGAAVMAERMKKERIPVRKRYIEMLKKNIR